jgi:serine/threonine protein kinase
VVKQLKPQAKNMARWQVAKRLFDAEAAVLYRLGDHDQIPRLLAHFEEDQEFFLVQEFIEGEPLDDRYLPRWTERQTMRRLHDILGTVSFVHRQKVIHRDIKPSNLIRRRKDGKLVLIDFGAVKQVSTPLDDSLLEQSLTVSIGTHGYMPPEQISGNPRYNSDLYAVGMIGIQALTGVHPSQLQRDSQTGEILWQTLNPSIRPAFAEILDRMVRYHFKDRYQTVDEPLQAIEQLIIDQGESLDEEPEEIEDLTNPTMLWKPEQGTEAMVSLGSATEPFPTVAEVTSETVNQSLEEAVPANKNLESLPNSKDSLPPEVLPDPSPSLLSIPRTLAVAPKAPTLTKSRIPLWTLLTVGGVIAVATALSTNLAPSRFQSIVPTQQPSTQASLLPNLPCREPPPPPLPSGKPDYQYADGTRYYGRVEANRPADGRGTMVSPKGNRYDGEFRNGRREGCGTYSFSSGKRYIGQFKADRFEGLGIWLVGGGNRYVGAFKDNRCNGEGIFLFSDNRSQRGIWQNGKLVDGNLSCDG